MKATELICEDVIVTMLLAGSGIDMEKEHSTNCRSALSDG